MALIWINFDPTTKVPTNKKQCRISLNTREMKIKKLNDAIKASTPERTLVGFFITIPIFRLKNFERCFGQGFFFVSNLRRNTKITNYLNFVIE